MVNFEQTFFAIGLMGNRLIPMIDRVRRSRSRTTAALPEWGKAVDNRREVRKTSDVT